MSVTTHVTPILRPRTLVPEDLRVVHVLIGNSNAILQVSIRSSFHRTLGRFWMSISRTLIAGFPLSKSMMCFEYYTRTPTNKTLRPVLGSPGDGECATLWAILAYTSAQCRGSMLDKFPPTPKDEYFCPKQIYDRARSLIPSDDSSFDLGHVQALLLLALIKTGYASWTAAWLLIGQALRLDIDLGLDRPPIEAPGSQAKARMSGRRKHCFLGCFVVDTLVSLRLGRQPYLEKTDVLTNGLLEEDGLEEWDAWVPCSTVPDYEISQKSGRRVPVHILSIFNRFTKLIGILSDIVRNASRGPLPDACRSKIFSEIEAWTAELPRQCLLTNHDIAHAHQDGDTLPHLLNLHLLFACIMSILQIHIQPRWSKNIGFQYNFENRAVRYSFFH